MAGWWQHRRSPYHLTCWLFYNQKKGEQKSWSACQQEAKAWSKVLWGQGATGPPEGDAPPPVPRADPERKKRDRDPDDPDGPGGFGSSGGKQQTQTSLLLQIKCGRQLFANFADV